jgi:hypothetical protein
MGVRGALAYLRWRRSLQGRAVYQGYAQAMEPQRALSPAPSRRARARVTGHAAGWRDFERPQRGVRRSR